MLNNLKISKHAQDQMQLRDITLDVVENTIQKPLSVVIEDGKKSINH